MRRVCNALILSIAALLGPQVWAEPGGTSCNLTDAGGGRCTACSAYPLPFARAYINVRFWCTVCNQFCTGGGTGDAAPSPDAVATARALNSVALQEERLLVSGKPEAFYSLASINPGVAVQLFNLFAMSAATNAPIPSQGSARSTRAFTAAAVIEAASPQATSESVERLTTEAEPGYHFKVTWNLVKRAKKSTLEMTYRVMDAEGREVGAPYPDIDISLVWQPSKSAGYWRAVGWSTR